MAITVLGGQRVLPQRLEKENFLFKFPRIENALRDLLSSG
jgi:NAD dependent epimerase/dehydratase family enzyme